MFVGMYRFFIVFLQQQLKRVTPNRLEKKKSVDRELRNILNSIM